MFKIKTKNRFQQSIFKPFRLIFENPPPLGGAPATETQKPREATKTQEELEAAAAKAKDEQAKQVKGEGNKQEDKHAEEVGKDITKPKAPAGPPEAQPPQPEKVKDQVSIWAKSYHEKLSETPKEEDLEKIRQLAESDGVSTIELQGGHEWLGLKDEEYGQKFSKLSQAYLKMEKGQDGRTSFTVRDELDHSYKTKMGLGAGHLLPPSIVTATIIDSSGAARTGRREIRNGKVGYYDENGYIPIFAGFKIVPGEKDDDYLDESGPKYKESLEAERQNYLQNKQAMETYEESGATTPDEVRAYVGKTNHPVTSLRSLNTATDEDLKSKGLNQSEIQKVNNAKVDYQRIEALLDNFNIRLDARSEITAGGYLVSLDGKGAGMLGYDEKNVSKENELFKKLTDKKHLAEALKGLEDGQEKVLEEGLTVVKSKTEKEGYYLKDTHGRKIEDEEKLKRWCIQKAAKEVERNHTVKFIEALQKGGENNPFNEYKFTGGYDLDLTHLDQLHRLANSKEELEKLISKAKTTEGKINSRKIIEQIFVEGTIPQGISKDAAFDFINRNRGRLGFLLGDQGQQVTLNDLIKMSYSKSPISVNYRWDTMAQASIYNLNGGSRCCAWTVSTLLGMGSAGVATKGKEGNVRGLLARLMASNRAKTGNEGIVFGYKNYQKGDVVIFRGTKAYADRKFSHVAIVRDRVNIDGREYLIFIDEGKNFQATIVPVDRGTSNAKYLAGALKSRKSEYLAKYPQLAAVYSERRYVHVRDNNDWWGDASTGRGYVAFGVRTSALAPGYKPAPVTPPAIAETPAPAKPEPRSSKRDEAPTPSPAPIQPAETSEKTPEINKILAALDYRKIADLDANQLENYFQTLKTAVAENKLTILEIIKKIIPDTVYAAGLHNSPKKQKTIAKAASRASKFDHDEHGNLYSPAYKERWIKLHQLGQVAKQHIAKHQKVFEHYAKTFSKDVNFQKTAYIFADRSLGKIPADTELHKNHHDALDIFFSKYQREGLREIGPAVHAVSAGIVISAAGDWQGETTKDSYTGGGINTPDSGNGVIIFNPMTNEYYYYSHMYGDLQVKPGDIVQAGQILGKSGNTGLTAMKGGGRSKHVHMEVHKYNPTTGKFTSLDAHDIKSKIES